MHTCYSDGELTPSALIDRRVSEGYQMLAITDHDGIEGSMVGMEYADSIGLPFISGIELDSEDELGRDLHILGYGFDPYNKVLRRKLWDVRADRARRNDIFMKELNEMGYGITLDDIGQINDGRYVGKPTFARILQQKGYLENYHEAFNTIFREDRLRKIEKKTMKTRMAINLVHNAGGLAVIAHPMEQRHLNESFEDFKPRLMRLLDRVREYGIDGVECKHPSASEEQTELLMEYADMHGLMITEGSDFHSDVHHRDFSRYHRP